MGGGLDYGKKKYDNCFSVRFVRFSEFSSVVLFLGRGIVPFFVKSYFIESIMNQLPETGRIMPWLRLFALAKGGGLILKSNHDRQTHLFRLNFLSSRRVRCRRK